VPADLEGLRADAARGVDSAWGVDLLACFLIGLGAATGSAGMIAVLLYTELRTLSPALVIGWFSPLKSSALSAMSCMSALKSPQVEYLLSLTFVSTLLRSMGFGTLA